MHREAHNGARRRSREDYEELDRFLEEATRSLEYGDLSGANEALEKAGAKATTMWGGISLPESLAHNTLLTGLIWDVQDYLDRPERTDPLDPLLESLEEVRCRFEREAREETGEITANEADALPRWDRSARIGLPRREAQ